MVCAAVAARERALDRRPGRRHPGGVAGANVRNRLIERREDVLGVRAAGHRVAVTLTVTEVFRSMSTAIVVAVPA